MKKRIRTLVKAAAASLLLAWAATPAVQAQVTAYPDKPIKLIIPLPPGGGADFLGRILAEHVGKKLGQAVIVENRGGAGGSIGSNYVAQAAADGYTLVFAYSASHSINPVISDLPYDPLADFTPIALVALAPNMLVVNPALPVNSIAELIALAKSKPGKLRYASAGVGSAPHMSAELFNHMVGTSMIHVPYKGAGPALVDVIGGHLELTFTSLPAGLPHGKSGAVRMLGVTSSKRSPLLPALPTIAEAGLPDFNTDQWYGVLGPKGLPQDIVDTLNKAIQSALELPEVIETVRAQGFEINHSSPDGLAAHMRTEIDKWQKLATEAKIRG